MTLAGDRTRLEVDHARLTSRQAEKLFEIRDATVFHRHVDGISVRNLITRCHEARLDLDEGDVEFIERLWRTGATELRGSAF